MINSKKIEKLEIRSKYVNKFYILRKKTKIIKKGKNYKFLISLIIALWISHLSSLVNKNWHRNKTDP